MKIFPIWKTMIWQVSGAPPQQLWHRVERENLFPYVSLQKQAVFWFYKAFYSILFFLCFIRGYPEYILKQETFVLFAFISICILFHAISKS